MDQTVKAGAPHIQGYTAFDVETPNRQQHSICSIGLVHVGPGKEPICVYYLVNPEETFDEANISIHGIRPADVKDAQFFLEIWDQISDWFTNGIVVAHNAAFDLSVLQKTLERHELPVPNIYCICTFEKAKKHIPFDQFGGHKLNLLCDGFHIPLDHHHNALDDAKACAAVYENLVSQYGCLDEDIGRWTSKFRKVA
ncbi:MAG: 3'-5' exonuclease [Clostridiaceae bacterium]